MFAPSLCILSTGGQQWFLEPKIAGSDPATPCFRENEPPSARNDPKLAVLPRNPDIASIGILEFMSQ